MYTDTTDSVTIGFSTGERDQGQLPPLRSCYLLKLQILIIWAEEVSAPQIPEHTPTNELM